MHGKSVSTSNLTIKEKQNVTPIIRGHGDGDGIRQNISAKKRVPVSSSRKFNARVPRDETVKLQLEKAMSDMVLDENKHRKTTPSKIAKGKSPLKSVSVAEITPTKTTKRRLSTISSDSCEIYATPRPFSYVTRKKFCKHERTACEIYRKLLLLAWRRSRSNGKSMQELLKKKEIQINQLEMQSDVLSNLRISESQKREQAQNECQQLKKNIDLLELENSQLNEDVQNMQNTLELYLNELKVAKAENNFLSEQSIKMQDIISKNKAVKMALDEKVKLHEEKTCSQKIIISNLESTLQETERKLNQTRINYGIREKKYAQLKCQFKTQLEVNNSISLELQTLKEEKRNISFKIEDLETQLNQYIESCESLKEVNLDLTQEVRDISIELQEERKQNWIRNAKQFALLSVMALQKIARVAVPAYLDGPANF